MRKIVLYGVGDNFQKMWSNQIYWASKKDYDIIQVFDKNERKLNNIDKRLETVSMEYLTKGDYDNICVTSAKYYNLIVEELSKKQIDCKKIKNSRFWMEFCVSQYLKEANFDGKGLEVGGPSRIFSGIYHNCVCDGVNYSDNTIWGKVLSEYRYEETILGKQYICDATDMYIIKNNLYDFLLSSNNLEHIANPLKAMEEFARVVKPGGNIVILVPNKKYTFDHARKYTTFEHLLNDYKNNVDERDLTHLNEIIELHDLDMDKEAGSRTQFIERCYKNYENRCLHHHVFSFELLEQMADYVGLYVIKKVKIYNDFCVILKKG